MSRNKKTRKVPTDEPAGCFEQVIDRIRQRQAQEDNSRIEFAHSASQFAKVRSDLVAANPRRHLEKINGKLKGCRLPVLRKVRQVERRVVTQVRRKNRPRTSRGRSD